MAKREVTIVRVVRNAEKPPLSALLAGMRAEEKTHREGEDGKKSGALPAPVAGG